jgi:hypothetical protein
MQLATFSTPENLSAIHATVEKAQQKMKSSSSSDAFKKAICERIAAKGIAIATITDGIARLTKCGIGITDARVALWTNHGIQLQRDLEELVGLL